MGLSIGLAYDLRRDYLAAGYTPEQVAEFDSDETIAALAETLGSLGHRVERIGHGRALAARLAAGDRWDLVFNICEGLHGRSREAQVPALLELFQVPYTFSDPLVCALTLDKYKAKQMVAAAGLATPAARLVTCEADLAGVDLAYPLFAKPLAEGTGKGIDEHSLVTAPAQLRAVCLRLLERFHQPVLVERHLPGREFTVGLLGTGAEARVLGTMEVIVLHDEKGIYSYDAKERCEQLVQYPAMEHGPLRVEVEALALAAYRVLECRDGGRIDIKLDDRGRPSFLEVNPLAGLHPSHSDLPMIATQEGMSYATLLQTIVDSAWARAQGAAHA
jgi:D-alanine-D-alanine ligase